MRRENRIGLIDPNQCVFSYGEPWNWEPGTTCPLPDIPMPHGTKRMRSIEWEKAWEFIQELSGQGLLDNTDQAKGASHD